MSKQSVNLTELFDYSRSSIATYIDPLTSARTTVGEDTPRFVSEGLIMERAATNLLLNSTAPVTQSVSVLNGYAYTLASYGDGAGYAFVSSGGSGSAPIGNPITFNASGGTVEISVSGTIDAYQLELGSEASNLIVTEGTTETRDADQFTRDVGSEYNTEEGTFYIEFSHKYQSIYGNNAILSNEDLNNFVYAIESGEYKAYNGTINRDYPSVSPVGDIEKLAISVKEDEWILSRNGSSSTYATSGDTLLDTTTLKFFATSEGILAKFEYWPVAKTAEELEAITE